MSKLTIILLFVCGLASAQDVYTNNDEYAVIVTDTLNYYYLDGIEVMTNANQVGRKSFGCDTALILDSLVNHVSLLPSLPDNGMVTKGDIYSYNSSNLIRIKQTHNRTTVNHFNPEDVPALYAFKSTATGCDAEEWDSGQHWSTYTVGELRTNNNQLWRVTNIAWTYYEPSGAYGYLGWEYVQDCN